MPTLQLDQFDEDDSPTVGDKVTIKGEIESIDTETGEVEVSYDSVRAKDKKKRKKSRDNDDDDDDDDDVNFVSLDDAMVRAFPQQSTAMPPEGSTGV